MIKGKKMEDGLYSTTQAAKLCRVTPGTIIYWIKKGKLQTSLTAGGHRRIPEGEILRLIKELRLPFPKELESLEPAQQKDAIRILVVDDERSVRQMILWVLKQSFPKVEVEEAEDGFVAGWKTKTFHPDLILLDLMMPGLDGFRFCDLVKMTAELKEVRIIAMSGIQGFGFEEKIHQMGVSDFLNKPFQIETLKEKVSQQFKVIEEKRKERSNGFKR